MFKYKDITERIIKGFYEVYNELGIGFLESVYEKALFIVLQEYGFEVDCQKDISVYFRGKIIGKFKADLIVNNKVIVELKAAKNIVPEHEAQILNYLRATDIEVGLLLNFGNKPEFKRFAFENNRKTISENLRISAATKE